ncbi:MAG: hypothetical protein WAT79_11380 [Saprospiraceae bacterium]
MCFLLFLLPSCNKQEKGDFRKDLSTAIEKRAGDCAEESQELFCQFTVSQTKIDTLTNVYGYPSNCSFVVSYDMKWCYVGLFNEIQVLVTNLTILSINCQQYHDDLDDIINNPGIGIPTLDDYLIELFYNLHRSLEDKVFNFFNTNHNLDCDSQTSFIPIVFKFVEDACYTFCVTQSGRPSEFDPVLKLRCGEVCCIITVYACYDATTNKIIKSIDKHINGGPDNPECMPLQNLSSICYRYSDCIKDCE